MPSSGPGNQGEVVVWDCQYPTTNAFEQLWKYLQQLHCPKKLIESEPLNICVNDVGGPQSTGYFVTGAQFKLSWKVGSRVRAVVWEVRWDADDKKGEHINLMITPRGDLGGSKMTWAFCSIPKHESGSVRVKEDAKDGGKPLLTSQSMYALTQGSRFDCDSVEAKTDKYRKGCAENVLSYWYYGLHLHETLKIQS